MIKKLDKLALDFFKLFARYEFALKDMGYVYAGRNNEANTDWDRFANDIGRLLFDEKDERVCTSLDYMLTNPPMKQVVVNGLVQWEEVKPCERNSQILFSYIRRVRNNLFHGAKFNGTWFDPERSSKLLSCSHILLEHCISLSEEIRRRIGNDKYSQRSWGKC